jgi:RES domain-containing protein
LSVSVPDGSVRDAATTTDPEAAGNAWLAARDAAAIRVPSVLVPHGFNILLHPLHPVAEDATIASVEPFRFDRRLWQPLGHE